MSVDASKLSIVHYPADVLRKKATALPQVTPEVRAVAARMIELMHQAEGIGLAAPQVGLSWRLFVACIPASEDHPLDATPPESTDAPRVYINPTFSKPVGAPEAGIEGCLSLPEIRGEVLRPPVITISALDLEGQAFSETGAGLLARCWQHEMDHLDGVLIIDRMTQMSRIKNRTAVRELERSLRR